MTATCELKESHEKIKDRECKLRDNHALSQGPNVNDGSQLKQGRDIQKRLGRLLMRERHERWERNGEIKADFFGFSASEVRIPQS